MTAQELLEYSHEPYQQELIDGILYEMEPPGAEHGAVVDARSALLLHAPRRATPTWASRSRARSAFG